MSDASLEPRWRVLVTPRWIGWHLFAVAAVIGMLWLGDWQLRRALAGNSLSWAYTFEWPLFAIFGIFFWTKTVRDELHPKAQEDAEAEEVSLPASARWPGAGATFADGASAAGSAQSEVVPGDPARDDAARGDSAQDDSELAEYNAYLAKLNRQVKGHGRWHGLR